MNTIRVVCAAIEKEDRVLAAKRSQTMSNPGMWEFPGGKVRPEESEQDALSRELREELGIEASVGERLGISRHDYPHVSLELVAYRCSITAGQLSPVEHEECRWVTSEETRCLDWSAADVPLVQAWRGELARRPPHGGV